MRSDNLNSSSTTQDAAKPLEERNKLHGREPYTHKQLHALTRLQLHRTFNRFYWLMSYLLSPLKDGDCMRVESDSLTCIKENRRVSMLVRIK